MAGGWGIIPPYAQGARIRYIQSHLPLWIWGTNRPAFIGPVPILNLGAAPSAGAAAGWISPVPFHNLGAGTIVDQGGFFSAIPGVPYGGDGTIVVDEGGRNRRTYFTMIGRTRLGR